MTINLWQRGNADACVREFIKISWSGLDFEQEQQHANA